MEHQKEGIQRNLQSHTRRRIRRREKTLALAMPATNSLHHTVSSTCNTSIAKRIEETSTGLASTHAQPRSVDLLDQDVNTWRTIDIVIKRYEERNKEVQKHIEKVTLH